MDISFETAEQREDWRRRMERAPCVACDPEKRLMLDELDVCCRRIASLEMQLSRARAEIDDLKAGH